MIRLFSGVPKRRICAIEYNGYEQEEDDGGGSCATSEEKDCSVRYNVRPDDHNEEKYEEKYDGQDAEAFGCPH